MYPGGDSGFETATRYIPVLSDATPVQESIGAEVCVQVTPPDDEVNMGLGLAPVTTK